MQQELGWVWKWNKAILYTIHKTYGFNFVVSMVRHTYNFFELIEWVSAKEAQATKIAFWEN